MYLKLENSKKIYYEIYGEGIPLLILNGIMMSTKSWEAFIDKLSKHNQLILMDFLDQGQSDKMADIEYDHSVHVESVKALIEHLNINKLSIYGVSYGGEIALQFAIKYQDCLDKLILFNTTSRTSYWLAEIGHSWNLAARDALSYYLATIPIIYSPKFFEENIGWIEERREILMDVFADQSFISSMIRLTNSSENYDVEDSLKTINVPTLVVGCQYDFVTPYFEQEKIAKEIKNSKLVYVPESGHALMYEKSDLFISLTLGFLFS